MSLRTRVADVEIGPNFFIVSFKNVETGAVYPLVWRKGEPRPDDQFDDVRHMLRTGQTVTFNGNHYDIPMLSYALAGASIKALKRLSDMIIQEDLKPWNFEREMGTPLLKINHVDLMEVAPGQASLKLYNGRLHGRRMQDLPYAHDQILTDEQIDETADYNINDLDATILLRSALKEQLDLREQLGAKYGLDFMSKSDAQIAEALIASEIEKITGQKPKRPEGLTGTRFRYTAPDFIRFRRPDLRRLLEDIRAAEFIVEPNGGVAMPPALADAEIRIGEGVYRLGIGGLHSSEQRAVHLAVDGLQIFDRDVTSYYPAIILNLGLAPKHLGKAFLQVYRKIVDARIEAKKAGRKVEADSLKIVVNGSFGKLGSKWSKLYSPDLMIRVTVTGQLSLLMLIERLEDAGITVASANTDGVVSLCRHEQRQEMLKIVAQWEKDTGFATEETEYKAIYSRDVNNYIAIKPNGTAKLKGAYAPTGLQKNPQNQICVDAIVARLAHGTPIETTITECSDITKFVTVRQVNGGAVAGGDVISRTVMIEGRDGSLKQCVKGVGVKGGKFLGKTIRWYYSTDGVECIRYRNSGNKVPRSEKTKPMMEMPKHFPDDIDYQWYINEAYSLLSDLGVKPQQDKVYKRAKPIYLMRYIEAAVP